ncbi:MAG: hypothetical protein IJ635_05540 [Bacteroidaceae bacterium]|nr:hypothetical protein [Bacteroidaceae bacterium]
MRRLFLMLLLMVAMGGQGQTLTREWVDVPLLEALQAIGREQSEYTIDILSDSLGDLRTSAKVKNRSVPDAVKLICKGLPVRVKRQGRNIFVQYRPEKDFTDRTIHLSGAVLDEFLKMPLPKAKISVLRADSSVVVDSADMVNFIQGSTGKLVMSQFGAEVKATEKTYWVRAQLDGYGDVWQRVDITDPSRENVEVPALKMRKVPSRMLREVTVTATKIKMFYRGDTLIYDATAFQLPEGSMLDDLIRQLPGVEMNEKGEIFVNGRKVDELLLGSRTFFGGNKKVLMENLPYYTVKHLKAYEKQTERSEALDYDVEPRRYVMDVILKDEYSQGYIANVEVAGGTEERWLGRGFLLGFTDRLRLTLLANANNVNESRHVGQTGQWSPARAPKSLLTTRSVAGEINYQSVGDKLKETLRTEYTSTTDEQTMNQRREQFLEGLAPTSLTESFNRAGNKKWTVHNTFSLTKPMYLRTEAHFDYAKRNGSSHSAFDEWSDSLTISQRTIGMSEGKAWAAYLEATGTFNINKQKEQHLSFYAKVEHDNDESRQAQRYTQTTQSFSSGIQPLSSDTQPLRSAVQPLSQTQYNTHDFFRRTTWATGNIGYNLHFPKNVNLLFTDWLDISSEHTRDYLYHPERPRVGDETSEISLLLPSQIDALTAITDPGNSYESRRHDWTNNLNIRLMKTASIMHSNIHWKMDYERWCLYIYTPLHHDELHYQRGVLDTLAHQTKFLPSFSFYYKNYWKGARRYIFSNLDFNQERPLLLDRITFRDDSQPLIVKLGNPNLKGKEYTKFNIEYYDNAGRNQGMCYLSASFNYHFRDVAQSLTYNPTNGVYTYKPMNVSGVWGALTNFSIDRNIGEKRYWSWHANAHALWDHAKDHAMLTGETESHVNTVNTLGLKGGAHIKYNKNAFNIRATGQINWRHSVGKMLDFETLNAFDFEYGIETSYTLPHLKTSLAADATMFSRRGYGSSNLNTDDFIVNASVSQPLLKGKLIARLEAFDLLHQLSNTEYMVNAQGRTVTWYRSLPHYVMLHLVYHWNKNPKK